MGKIAKITPAPMKTRSLFKTRVRGKTGDYPGHLYFGTQVTGPDPHYVECLDALADFYHHGLELGESPSVRLSRDAEDRCEDWYGCAYDCGRYAEVQPESPSEERTVDLDIDAIRNLWRKDDSRERPTMIIDVAIMAKLSSSDITSEMAILRRYAEDDEAYVLFSADRANPSDMRVLDAVTRAWPDASTIIGNGP